MTCTLFAGSSADEAASALHPARTEPIFDSIFCTLFYAMQAVQRKPRHIACLMNQLEVAMACDDLLRSRIPLTSPLRLIYMHAVKGFQLLIGRELTSPGVTIIASCSADLYARHVSPCQSSELLEIPSTVRSQRFLDRCTLQTNMVPNPLDPLSITWSRTSCLLPAPMRFFSPALT